MTPPDLIRADYPTLDQVATTFNDERDRVQRVQESIARHLERLKNGGWVSDAADRFYREMDDDLLPSLERLKTALGAAGETTRRIVQIMRQAEQEAAAALKETDEAATNGDAVTPQDLSQIDHEKLRVRYSPLFQETTPEPPIPASEDQLTALAELGIVIPADAELTSEEAQAMLDFYAAHPQGLLAEGMSFADVQQAIAIVERAQEVGLGVGVSRFNPKPWTLTDLQHLNNTIQDASQTAHDQFFAQFEDPAAAEAALVLAAERMGLGDTDDAALRLFFSPQGIAFSFLRDAGVNVNLSGGDGPDDTVGYTDDNPENPAEVYRAYDGEYINNQEERVQYTIVYDPTGYDVYDVYGGPTPAGYIEQRDGAEFLTSDPDILNAIVTNTTRNARFYGWYDGDNVILADSVLLMGDGETHRGPITGVFTAEALIGHESGHAVDNANTALSGILGNSTEGLTYNARTSTAGNEVRADIIMNGMLGIITTDAQQANYDAYAAQILAENFESVAGTSLTDFEASFAEATPEATEPPPSPEETPNAPNV